jgi:hypothetical protein
MSDRHPSPSRRLADGGSSLVSLIVAISIVTVVAFVLTRVWARHKAGQDHIGARDELETIRYTLLTRFDCDASLGHPSAPRSCATTPNVKLRDRTDQDLAPNDKIGAWTVTAGCDPACVTPEGASCANEVIVKATRSGADPLTKRAWSTLPVARDLFTGTSDFCHKYFVSSERRLEYAGVIKRCMYTFATGATILDDPTAMWVPSGEPVNEVSGTHDCPAGFVPRYTWGFTDYGCGPNATTWYSTEYWGTQCAFWAADGTRFVDMPPPQEPQSDCATPTPGSCWRGCSLAVYSCVKAVWR